MNIGIVGYGHVGQAMHKLFVDALIYDKFKNIGKTEEINECDTVFICVPTPQMDDCKCDTSIVDEIFEWLSVDLAIIRSTVPVGYTKAIAAKKKTDIVFQPEYYGETVSHPFSDLTNRAWLTFGGEKSAINKAIKTYKKVIDSDVHIVSVDSNTAELAKYMDNTFLATKVVFCNEFYNIATALDVDYNLLREVWLADYRIGRSHTFVYEDDRGFGGSCLPKDISAIISTAKELNVDVTLLEAVVKKNDKLKLSTDKKHT